MPKIFPIEQREMVNKLSDEGHSHVEIAKRMSDSYPDDWGAKTAHRSVARILKNAADEVIPDNSKTLDEMTREERFRHIQEHLEQTPRFRMTFSKFNDTERLMFIDEYLNVIRSTNSLTEIEEQTLFAAILEYVLAYQALNRKEQEEKFRDDTMEGVYTEGDPQFRRIVDDKYHKEYDAHMKMYQKFSSELKMSRAQRLKEITSQKISLVDLAQDLSSKNAQSEVAEEIDRLSKIKDSELKKLLELGHLHGIFEEFA